MEINTRLIENMLMDIINPIIGDTPVSVQIVEALRHVARQDDVSMLSSELSALRKEVDRLTELVGDVAVSEQINMAINKPEN